MPAQFISTRAMPWAASALAMAALICFFVGDVGVEGNALHFGGDLLGIFLVLVDDADFRALGSHGAGGGGT